MYIGITKDTNIRWKSKGVNYKHSTDFYNEIKEIGWNNFDHIVLIDNISLSMALIFECELIKKYNLTETGYNTSKGSWNTPKPVLSKPIYQYSLDGTFIQKWESVREAIKAYGHGIYECLSGKYKSSHNYRWTWEYLDKLPFYEKKHDFAKIKYPKREIVAYGLDGKLYKSFASYDELDEIYDKRIVKILCEQERKYVYNNLIWGYPNVVTTDYIKDLIKKHFLEFDIKRKGKYKYNIIQYDLDGNYLTTYKNAYEAELKTGCGSSVIINVCRGLMKVGADH